MTRKGGCVPSAPSNSPAFLDSQMASLLPKMGYSRALAEPGPPPGAPDASISASSVAGYVYAATPTHSGVAGARGFGGDHSGRVCQTPDGTIPATTGQGALASDCTQIR
jgi:hypothetical protein